MTFTDDANRGLWMESCIVEFYYTENPQYILLKDLQRIWGLFFKIIDCRWTKSAASSLILRWWWHQPRRNAMFELWFTWSVRPHHENRDAENQIIFDKLSTFRASPKFRSRYMLCFTAIIFLVAARILFEHNLSWCSHQVWNSKTPSQMRISHSLMMEIAAFGWRAVFWNFIIEEIPSTFY